MSHKTYFTEGYYYLFIQTRGVWEVYFIQNTYILDNLDIEYIQTNDNFVSLLQRLVGVLYAVSAKWEGKLNTGKVN